MQEGTLAKWLVRAADAVRPSDLLAEVETDKAIMEFEAVDEGVIEGAGAPAFIRVFKALVESALASIA